MARAFAVLAITIFSFQFSFGITRSIQSNYFVETLGVRADQMGLMTAFRELPGLLSFATAAATMGMPANLLAAVSFAVMGLGYTTYGFANDFETVVPAVVLASIGFHTWIPLMDAFGLSLTTPERAGLVLGRLRSIGFAASLVSMVLTFFLIDHIGFQTAFYIGGAVLIVGVVAMFFFPKAMVRRDEARVVFRRKYGLFYTLNFLDGCRMEVFQAFGVFLLVKQYGITVQVITLLLIVSSVINMIASPIVGRTIDRLGERRTMTFSYGALFFVFLGFALYRDATVAVGLYVAYNFFLLFSIGINTYLKRIAPAPDVRPSLVMGLTTMHISALTIPPIGGILWERYGFEVPFLLGAAFIALAMLATQRIPDREAMVVAEPVSAA